MKEQTGFDNAVEPKKPKETTVDEKKHTETRILADYLSISALLQTVVIIF